jgi:hypothetical protein
MSPAQAALAADIKIFCDESCHLEHDSSNVMVFGAIYCVAEEVEAISRAIKALRQEHNYHTEIKWTKLAKRHWSFYQALLDLVLDDNSMRFKVTVVENKKMLDHEQYNDGSHGTFYYKMAYYTLRDFIERGKVHRIYLDYMDTLGATKAKKLAEVLLNSCYGNATIEAHVIRSHESQLIQLCDLLIGAVAYANRTDIQKSSVTKLQIVRHLEEKLSRQLTAGTPPWGNAC